MVYTTGVILVLMMLNTQLVVTLVIMMVKHVTGGHD